MHRLLLVAALVAAAGRLALADQCEIVTEAQAQNARRIVMNAQSTFAAFCEPCGDRAATLDRATTIEVRKLYSGFALYLSGKPVDLAYTFVPLPSHRFRNLAIAVGCAVEGVSETIGEDRIRKP